MKNPTLNEISQNYNVPKIKAIKDLLKLADAVSIVTPTTTHKDIALLALDNDCNIVAAFFGLILHLSRINFLLDKDCNSRYAKMSPGHHLLKHKLNQMN